jgi:hypothetical protein
VPAVLLALAGTIKSKYQTADMLRDKIRAAATRAGTNFVFKDAIPPFIRTGHSSGYTPLVRAVLG